MKFGNQEIIKNKKLINESIDASNKRFENCDLLDCTITGVSNTEFINCNLYNTNFYRIPLGLNYFYNLTITLNCNSFKGLKITKQVVYFFLYLITLASFDKELKDKILGIIPDNWKRYCEKGFNVEI